MIYVMCGDNGFGYDGPLNCCVTDYGYCDSDEGCCGSLVCAGGQCADPELAAQGGLPLGAQCVNAGQCIGGGDYVDCADYGAFTPGCCLAGGQSCSADIDCCIPNNCIGGICQ
jgi:hypothetical protein